MFATNSYAGSISSGIGNIQTISFDMGLAKTKFEGTKVNDLEVGISYRYNKIIPITTNEDDEITAFISPFVAVGVSTTANINTIMEKLGQDTDNNDYTGWSYGGSVGIYMGVKAGDLYIGPELQYGYVNSTLEVTSKKSSEDKNSNNKNSNNKNSKNKKGVKGGDDTGYSIAIKAVKFIDNSNIGFSLTAGISKGSEQDTTNKFVGLSFFYAF
jgi:hypothetical protein